MGASAQASENQRWVAGGILEKLPLVSPGLALYIRRYLGGMPPTRTLARQPNSLVIDRRPSLVVPSSERG